jgi:hypothetical protein
MRMTFAPKHGKLVGKYPGLAPNACWDNGQDRFDLIKKTSGLGALVLLSSSTLGDGA